MSKNQNTTLLLTVTPCIGNYSCGVSFAPHLVFLSFFSCLHLTSEEGGGPLTAEGEIRPAKGFTHPFMWKTNALCLSPSAFSYHIRANINYITGSQRRLSVFLCVTHAIQINPQYFFRIPHRSKSRFQIRKIATVKKVKFRKKCTKIVKILFATSKNQNGKNPLNTYIKGLLSTLPENVQQCKFYAKCTKTEARFTTARLDKNG